MTIIAETLGRVTLEGAVSHRNLGVFPLLGEETGSPDYLILEEALDSGCTRVTEVSEAGSVPELKLVNECEQPVLLLDGEELVGAKQNRILNLTILAPAGKATVIPVSCVEAGRWYHESAEFRSAARAHYSSGRARKAAQVSDSLRVSGSRRSDQGAVWDDIALKSGRMGAESRTHAAAAMYEAHRVNLEEFVEALPCRERQVGAVFTINGAVMGLDLFDNPATYARQAGKLVRSYALDAIDAREEEGSGTEEVARNFLAEAAAARQDRFPAVGLGEDVRLSGPRLTGAALEAEGRVVHLCAFRLAHDSGGTRSFRGTRMVRASRRRRDVGPR
jgi:hypothetical protein